MKTLIDRIRAADPAAAAEMKGASEREVAKLEKEWGRPLPAEIREFLLAMGQAMPELVPHVDLGWRHSWGFVGRLHRRKTGTSGSWIRRDPWFPLGATHSVDSHFIYANVDGLFLPVEEDSDCCGPAKLADSLMEYLFGGRWPKLVHQRMEEFRRG